MKSYGQFCPISLALDIVGERWTLLVIRELICGSRRFVEILRGVPRMPRSMLSRRLKQLEDAGLVCRTETDDGVVYQLTEAGWALRDVIMPLGEWGRRFVQHEIDDDQLDASLLMWDMRRGVEISELPDEHCVVRFEFTDGERGYERFWLSLDHGDVDLCLTNPGFDESMVVTTDRKTLTEVWMGHRDFREAIRCRAIRVVGPRRLVSQLPRWFKLNVFAGVGARQRAS